MTVLWYAYLGGCCGVHTEDLGMRPGADHQDCMQHVVHLQIITIHRLPAHLQLTCHTSGYPLAAALV